LDKFDRNKIYTVNIPFAEEREKYTNNLEALWHYGGVYASNLGINTALISGYDYVCRLDHDDYYTEIDDLILAAKADLQLSGLLGEKILNTDALIKRAIYAYCKANFGWNNPDAVRLQQSYDMLKNHMSLSSEYAFYAVTFAVTDESAVAIDEAKIVFDGVTKYTNSQGIAMFYVRKGDNYEYQITHDDYIDYVDSDNEWYNVDISASTTVSVTMTTS
jgi:glycosyltransferase involved in cell wall biosynthesis